MASENSHSQSIINALSGYQHRLVSLQVSLHDAYRNAVISEKQYQKRAHLVRTYLGKIQQLQNWQTMLAYDEEHNYQLGMPPLKSCSLEELTVCTNYLQERAKILTTLNRDCAQVRAWVEKATQGKSWSLFITFQLSKLRKKMAKYANQINSLGYNDEFLNHLIADLTQIGKPKSKKQAAQTQSNIEEMMVLFNKLDAISMRIATLRQKVQQGEAQLQQMQQWLDRYQQESELPLQFKKPPDAIRVMAAAEKAGVVNMSSLDNSKRRLTLAHRYLEAQGVDAIPATSFPTKSIFKNKKRKSKRGQKNT